MHPNSQLQNIKKSVVKNCIFCIRYAQNDEVATKKDKEYCTGGKNWCFKIIISIVKVIHFSTDNCTSIMLYFVEVDTFIL